MRWLASIMLMVSIGISSRTGQVLADDTKALKPGPFLVVAEGRLATVVPDGGDLAWHSDEWRPGDEEIHPFCVRLASDRSRVAYLKGTSLYVNTLGKVGPGVKVIDAPKRNMHASWCWSADDRKLAVGWRDKDKELPTRNYIVDVNTGRKTELRLPEGHIVTDWSADSEWFLTWSSWPTSVMLMKRDGSSSRRIETPEPYHVASKGRFSPDGQRVLFSMFHLKDRTGKLHVADLTSREIRQIGPVSHAEPLATCWSPDGRQIISSWRRSYHDPTPQQKAEFFLLIMDQSGADPLTIRNKTGMMPADAAGGFQLNWLTFAGLDWR